MVKNLLTGLWLVNLINKTTY